MINSKDPRVLAAAVLVGTLVFSVMVMPALLEGGRGSAPPAAAGNEGFWESPKAEYAR